MNNKHFILNIHLKNVTSPLVTRVVCVPHNITLIKLAQVINEAMGWLSCHLHMFQFADENYGEIFDFDDGTLIDQRRKYLHKILGRKKQFTYVYDFGDHWEHQIIVKPSAQSSPHKYFVIMAEGACPPEDCGGEPGYQDLKQIIANPDDPEYDDMREWCGDDFDPNVVDIDLIQQRLNNIK